MDTARWVASEHEEEEGGSLLDTGGVGSTPRTMAKVGALIFGTGAVLAAAGVVLPHPAGTDTDGFLLLLAGIVTAAVVLWLVGNRFPAPLFALVLAAGSAFTTIGLYLSGHVEGASPVHFKLLYLVMTLYAAYFFNRLVLGAQIALTGVAYGVVLSVEGPDWIAITQWVITVFMVSIAGIMVRLMKERLDDLFDRLDRAARTDYLTGLLNRRGFTERFEYELEVSRRSGRPLTLLIGDLDHFKDVNDRLGHPAGDEALVKVAETLESTRRRLDTAARIGGEEFALLTPFTDAKGGLAVAERFRAEVARKLRVSKGAGRTGPVTVSVGVVSFPAHGQTVEALLHAADRALYAAKEQGRDQAVVFKPHTVPSYAGVPVSVKNPEEGNGRKLRSRDSNPDLRDQNPASYR